MLRDRELECLEDGFASLKEHLFSSVSIAPLEFNEGTQLTDYQDMLSHLSLALASLIVRFMESEMATAEGKEKNRYCIRETNKAISILLSVMVVLPLINRPEVINQEQT